MKYCHKCGTAMDDSAQFCPSCGTPGVNASGGVIRAPAPIPQPPAPGKQSRGKRKLAWAAVISVFLILAIVVSCSFGLFDSLFYGNSTGIRDDEDDPSTRTTGSRNTEPENTEPPDTDLSSEPVTIRVWASYDDQTPGNSWLEAMQERFEQKHPECNITWANSPVGAGDAGSLVIQDVTAAADVYTFPTDQLTQLINSAALSRLVGDYEDQVLRDNNDLMVNTVTGADGNLYAFPVSNYTWFLYYNKSIYTEEDVKSLDTMLEKGRVHIPMDNAWQACTFFLGTGCTIFGDNGTDAFAGIDFGGQKGYMAAKKMVELKNNPNVLTEGNATIHLLEGSCSAFFSGSWDYNTAAEALGDDLGVAMLPTFTIDHQEYQMKALSRSQCVGVNPSSGSYSFEKQQICTEFAAFLASEEAQLARYKMRGVIPAHQNLRSNELIMADQMAVAEMDTVLYASVVQSSLPEMDYFWTPMGNFCSNIVSGDFDLYNYEEAVDNLMKSLNP